MTGGGTKSTPFSEKIIAILLCKWGNFLLLSNNFIVVRGDLSDEEIDSEPCSTMELVSFFFYFLCQWIYPSSDLLQPVTRSTSQLVSSVLHSLVFSCHSIRFWEDSWQRSTCSNLMYFLKPSKRFPLHFQAEGDDTVLAAVMVIVYIYVAGTVIQFLFNFVQVRVVEWKCMMQIPLQQYLLLTVTNEIVDRLRREYVAAVLRLDAESLDETSPGKLSAELNEFVSLQIMHFHSLSLQKHRQNSRRSGRKSQLIFCLGKNGVVLSVN